MKFLFLFLLLFATALPAQVVPYPTIKELRVHNKGMVVSAHPLASEAGALVLRQGGNAFDAAIATQFALAVVYPQAGNLGGGGFMVGRTASGENLALDFRETAPGKAHADMYLDSNGRAQTDLSQYGHLAVGVPGTVAGIFALHPRAQLSMDQLIQPAITLAKNGFAITAREAALLNSHQKEFAALNTSSNAFVRPTAWVEGDILVQKDLANTLERIARNGKEEFYTGTTAKLITKEMQRGGGILSLQDLALYRPLWRNVQQFHYRGHQVLTMPLPSSGGILLQQMLSYISKEDFSGMQFHSPRVVHTLVEAERRAFADRAEYMGDPAFIKDPSALLTSEQYLTQRWKSFDSAVATPSAAVGKVVQPLEESTETTHISIYDALGNAVSLTTTLNGLYGSKVVVDGGGFFLNNEMDDFSIKPGVPNMFGAVGGKANAVAPGKRMLSSMSPTIVVKNNKPVVIVGTPGGTTIPTSVFQTLVALLDFKIDPGRALHLPRFHHQWLPDSILYEEGLSLELLQDLKSKQHALKSTSQIGRVELIVIGPTGEVHGVADPRGDDSIAYQ